MKFLKAQGATEYLVLFAVVLIIVMVVVALLGFFPNMAGGTQQTTSDTYWAGTRPLSIVNQKVNSTGNVTVMFQNNEAYPVTIPANGLKLQTTKGTDLTWTTDPFTAAVTLGPGDAYTTSTGVLNAGKCTAATTYQYYVKLAGYTENGIPKDFTGLRPIQGSCS